MNKITAIKAREILDSRGNPTIEAEVLLKNCSGIAKVPSGASTGKKEALELRDQDPKRYMGKGVLKAINNITTKIQPALLNKSADDQRLIDQLLIDLDGTENKSNLGANAILAVSLAVARANAKYHNLELFQYLQTIFNSTNNHDNKNKITNLAIPTPLINIINGGAHADNNLTIQEFMIVPIGAPNFKEALRWSVEVFYTLKSIFKKQQLSTTVGDEGGFAPNLTSPEQAMDYILEAIHTAGLRPQQDIALALDLAANEFFHNNYYHLQTQPLSTEKIVTKLANWTNNYPIISIEDGLAEDDLAGWQLLTQKLGNKIQLVGDDLFVTNYKIFEQLLKTAKDQQQPIANAILIKLNQIGTLSETFDTINLAQQNNYNYIISHRSGETEDDFIADLAVATNAKQIKTGSVCRSERVTKYNRLLRIEECLY